MDRFFRGFIAGIIGGVPSIIFNNLTKYFHFSSVRFSDFFAVFIYGFKTSSLQYVLFSIFGQFIFFGILGSIFAFMLLGISSQGYIIKGWLFGATIWFLTYAVVTLFKLPNFKETLLSTSVSNFIGASIWGIVMALSLAYLDKKVGQKP